MTFDAILGTGGYPDFASWYATVPAVPTQSIYRVLVQPGTYNEAIVWNRANVTLHLFGNSLQCSTHDFAYGIASDFPVFDQQGIRATAITNAGGGLIVQNIATNNPTSEHWLDAAGHGPQSTQFLNCRCTNGVNVYNSGDSAYSLYVQGCYFLNHTANGLEYYNFAAAPNTDVKYVGGNVFHYTDDAINPGFGIVTRMVTTDRSRGNIYGNLFLNEVILGQGLRAGAFGAGGLVEYNQFIAMVDLAWRTGWVDQPWLIRDNYCARDGNSMFTGFQVQHNTTVDIFRNMICNTANYGVNLTAAATGTVRSWNNIFCDLNRGQNVFGGATLDNDFNCYFNIGVDEVSGAGVYNDPEPNWILADPQRDPTSYRSMSLRSTSPCINAGTPADGLEIVKFSDAGVAQVDMGCQQHRPAGIKNG